MVALIIVFFISSCSSQLNKTTSIINIFEVQKTELNISEIAENIEYIPLASDSILATIMQVAYADKEYFIVDNKSKFLRFTKNGELLNQIGNKGNGPGEYRFISDFVVYPTTNDIYLTGGKPGQLLVFSSEGKFIKSIKLSKESISTFGISEQSLFLFYLNKAHDEENMELLNVDGNLIKNYRNKYEFKRNRAIVEFSGECLTYQFKGKLHFKEIFSDTLFCIEGQKIIPKIVLNTEGKRFTPEVRTELIDAMSKDRQTSRKIFAKNMIKYVIQRNLLESSKYLFYSYDFNQESQTLIIDKTDGKLTQFNTNVGILNDLDGGPNIIIKSKNDDNNLLTWINAFEIKTLVQSDAFRNSTPKYPKKKKELEKLANSLNENDNPVLMLVKLKE